MAMLISPATAFKARAGARRHLRPLRVVLSTALAAGILLLAGTVPATAAEPCTAADDTCLEWVVLGSGPVRTPVYRTHPLDVPDPAITTALLLVHGGGRNAAPEFRLVAEAARARRGERTLVVAPRFGSNDGFLCDDTFAKDEANWGCQGASAWTSGGPAMNAPEVTTYDVVDRLLRRLADRATFPALTRIVIAGHSAGGQFVTRYSLSNQVHDTLGVPVSYVVSNPASYAYPDPDRLALVDGRLQPSDRVGFCSFYDDWPYGLKDRRGYATRLSDEQLRQQLRARPVTYLLGELDNFANRGFDASCAAMAQGASRLERGQRFAAWVNGRGARHAVVVVPGCGHSSRCMFTAERAQPVLFPEP